ncbi:MAG TPA: GGDEF domain-containing response regulator [Verrucomicrobiae bacterium]|nr:GGDEF domain-containing response regulator [Verrucomicrobiae bacterium]
MRAEAANLEPAIRMLVVEDSVADARLLREALRDARAHVDLQQVSTLAEAERAVRDQTYDCVLLDLGLPDANGIDNVQRIRAANRSQTVVIMTGLDCEKAALGTLQRGAQDYLVKGRYDGAFIMRVIRRAMERNRVLNDVDQLREYQYYIATHDPLTGLPNRKLFEDRATSALAQAQREGGWFAVGYVDLDGFKPINDTHGHAVGDAVLRAVGQALSESVRATDTVARVGGDEFLVLLTPLKGYTASDVDATTKRLLERVGAVRKVEGRNVRVSASLGLAFYPQHGRTLESLLLFADHAMYRHKRRDPAAPEATTYRTSAAPRQGA